MAKETVRNAIERLAADRQQLETRIRQIDQSISLLESIAHKGERLTPRPSSPMARPIRTSPWQR